MCAMTSVEQLVEALRMLAEQQHGLQTLVATMAQASTANLHNMEGGKGKKGKNWDDEVRFKNIKMFSGEFKEWDEFAGKLKGQIAAGSAKVAEMVDLAETMVEAELMKEDYGVICDETECSDEEATEEGHKMYNLLLNITTGEANAVVRRCPGRNGWLA